MAEIIFPSLPVLDEEYTHPDTGTIYKWNGTQWRIKGSSSGSLNKKIYPFESLTLPSDPTFKLVATVNLINSAFEDLNTVIINVEGIIPASTYYAKLYVQRNGSVIQRVETNDLSQFIFYYKINSLNNTIDLYIYNESDRPTFSMWSSNDSDVVFVDSPSITSPTPPVDSSVVTQDAFVVSQDLNNLFVSMIDSLNSMSDFIDDNTRVAIFNS